MATIGVIAAPLLGHLAPMIRAVDTLAGAGHRLVVWAPPYSHGPIAAAGAEPRTLPGTLPVRGETPSDTAEWSTNGLAAVTAEAAVTMTGDVVAALHGERLDLVVHDAQTPWGRIAAEWLGLPRACSFPLFPPGLNQQAQGGQAPAPNADFAARLEASREAIVRAWGVEIGGFGDVVTNLADVTLCYSTARILGGEPPGGRWRLVGPLLEAGEPSPGADQVVYLALGTMFNRRPEPFRAIIDALAGEWPLLVSTGGGPAADRIGPLPAGTEVVPFLEPRKALARAVVHVTHGGGSSIHEALVAGVPMVCIPQGSDQRPWGARLQALGAGILLGDLAAEPLRAAVQTAASDPQMRARAGELAAHLRSYDGASRLTAAIEELL